MGDRTYVCLTVLSHFHDQVLHVFKDNLNESNITYGKEFSHFDFYDVNYGELPHLDELQDLGIAFDSEWEAGSEYGPGITFCRFTPEGDIQLHSMENEAKNPSMEALIARIDDPEDLRQYILEHKKLVTPLSWNKQVEYGQLYRAKQLINA